MAHGSFGHILLVLEPPTVATVTGTSAQTLANATSAASGSSVTGTVARTLDNATSAASGSEVVGTSAQTLANFTSTATGTHTPFTGTVAQTLQNFTSAASGTFGSNVTGTVAVTLANATSTASGSEVTGTVAQTLGNATSTATGGHGVAGTSARTLANFTSTASGSEVVGTSARTLANATSTATGQFGSTVYILNDDFPGSSIDSTIWDVYNRLGDQANSEVNAVIPANVRVSGGSLLIDSKFEDVTIGDTFTAPTLVHYTSGQVAQKATPFLYGRVDVRAKLPGGTGAWPCIWMLGAGWQPGQPGSADDPGAFGSRVLGEIDIAEFMNNARTTVNCQIHWDPGGGQVNPGGIVSLPYNATSRFMVYRLDWAPASAIFSVDPEDGSGFQVIQTITGAGNVPDRGMYLIIHTAIGGIGGGTPSSGTFPVTFEVDYARVAMTSDSINNGAAIVTLANATSTASGSEVTGTVARTLANATAAASGSSVTGTSARTLANATATASGAAGGAAGTTAVTLGNATASATGAHGVAGTSAITLANATSAATGAFGSSPVGTVAVTLANATSAASGSSTVGSSAASLANATSSATGALGVSGSLARTLAPFTATAAGSETLGTAGATLAPFTATAAGSETLGSLSRTLANATASATGTFGQIYIITGRLTTSRADVQRSTARADRVRTTEGVR